MKLLPKGTNILDAVINLFIFLAGILFIYLMLSVFIEAVILRYFLGITTDWIREVAQYTLLFMTFLGTAWVLRNEGHVKMDLLLERLKPKPQALMNIITSVVAAIACLVVAWYGVRVTWDDIQTGYYMASALQPSSWFLMLIIPIGSFLLFIQFLRRISGFLRSWRAS